MSYCPGLHAKRLYLLLLAAFPVTPLLSFSEDVSAYLDCDDDDSDDDDSDDSDNDSDDDGSDDSNDDSDDNDSDDSKQESIKCINISITSRTAYKKNKIQF
jgi:hypothetical protein